MTKRNLTKPTALLLAGVLVTSCFVGGTFARYITTTSSEDSARVAVWGINADDVEMNLFASEYDVNGNKVAKSWDGAKIIAPGTSMASKFSIVNLDDTLAPEVMYEVRIDVDDTEIDQRILDNPSIQWKLDDNSWGTWESTKADILALSGDASGRKVYAPLEIAEEFAAGKTHTIAWQWMLNDNNVQDTTMGNEAVDEDIIAKIVVKVTARQVQDDTVIATGGVASLNGLAYDSLQEAVNAVTTGDTIFLTEDVTVDSGDNAISYTGASSFTLDLNGNTFTANTTNAALRINTDNADVNVPVTVNIKNGTVTANSSVYSALIAKGKAGYPLTVNTENVKFNGNNPEGAVIKIFENATVNLNNGTIVNANNSYVGIQSNSTLNVNDGVEIYYNGSEANGSDALIGVAYNGVANIYGGKGVSSTNGFYAFNSGGTINVYDGVWSAGANVLKAETKNGTESIVNVSGGKFDGGFKRTDANSKIEISGGSFSADPTSYVADGYNVTNTGNGDYPFVVE